MTDSPTAPGTVSDADEKHQKKLQRLAKLAELKTHIGKRALLQVALSVGDKRNGLDIPVILLDGAIQFGNVRGLVKTDFTPSEEVWIDSDRLRFEQ